MLAREWWRQFSDPVLDALIAQGLANITAPLFGGIAATGALGALLGPRLLRW